MLVIHDVIKFQGRGDVVRDVCSSIYDMILTYVSQNYNLRKTRMGGKTPWVSKGIKGMTVIGDSFSRTSLIILIILGLRSGKRHFILYSNRNMQLFDAPSGTVKSKIIGPDQRKNAIFFCLDVDRDGMVKKERGGCFTHLLTPLSSTMMAPPVTFVLPDLMAGWPFKTTPNPHATKINAESAAWVQSYDAFNAKAQRTFDRCNFGAFAALAYPKAEPAHYRAAVDLINFYFVYDELSDEASGETVRKQAAAIMSAIRYVLMVPLAPGCLCP